jgi:hypothetical protein
MTRLGLALIAAAALVGPGCTSIFHRPHFAHVRPFNTPFASQPREAARSAYYQSAVRAIDRRDYALALDLLQAARAQSPNDPAVINAFGVVYDKLGRFDLSARYYTQAAALDPNSPIVQQNLAYSARLQGRWTAQGAATALASADPVAAALLSDGGPTTAPAAAAPTPVLLGGPPAPPKPAIAVAQAPAPVKPTITIASAPAPTVVLAVAANGAILTGRSLQIIDASGAEGGAEGVRQQLASRGWSAPKSAVSIAQAESRTRIVFPQGGLAIAQALARTLPFPVEVAACDNKCTSLSLIVGQDAPQRQRARS